MALILPLNNTTPQFGSNCWLAPNATVVGDVIMGNECTVWFNAVVRGDVNTIRIGNRVNIQDGAIIHCTYEKAAVVIGSDVSIAHGAIVHGCTLHDRVLIGMKAVVMDHAVVESNAMVAAGAVVLEKTIIRSGEVWGGTPARKIKMLSEEDFKFFIERTANNYVMYAGWYQPG
jgi:carbonic anhydrase/acetyltransferase-like protein (isoleucine patch superfamily)